MPENYKISSIWNHHMKKVNPTALKKGGLFVSTYLLVLHTYIEKINLQCGQKQEKCVKKWKVFHILGEEGKSSLCLLYYYFFQENTENFCTHLLNLIFMFKIPSSYLEFPSSLFYFYRWGHNWFIHPLTVVVVAVAHIVS